MSGRIVTGALVVTALGVGALVGLAAPKEQQGVAESSSPSAQDAGLAAQVAARDQWVQSLTDAAVVGRVQGVRVALLITDGTDDATVVAVTDALARGGATVETTGRLGADWWDPNRQSFRGELATQMSASIVGVDGLGASGMLEHAIVQAMVPGALPTAEAGPTAGSVAQGTVDGASNQEVLLDVLTRAKILTLDHPADGGIDALVLVTDEGPEGSGAAVNATATVWEHYVGATEIVVQGESDAAAGSASGNLSGTAKDAAAAAVDTPTSTRPSVVVISEPAISTAEIVMALKEQVAGGSGAYGTAPGLDIVAIP